MYRRYGRMYRPIEELRRVGTLVVHHLETDEIREVALDNEEGIKYVAESMQRLGFTDFNKDVAVYKGPYGPYLPTPTQLPLATTEERAKLEVYL